MVIYLGSYVWKCLCLTCTRSGQSGLLHCHIQSYLHVITIVVLYMVVTANCNILPWKWAIPQTNVLTSSIHEGMLPPIRHGLISVLHTSSNLVAHLYAYDMIPPIICDIWIEATWQSFLCLIKIYQNMTFSERLL